MFSLFPRAYARWRSHAFIRRSDFASLYRTTPVSIAITPGDTATKAALLSRYLPPVAAEINTGLSRLYAGIYCSVLDFNTLHYASMASCRSAARQRFARHNDRCTRTRQRLARQITRTHYPSDRGHSAARHTNTTHQPHFDAARMCEWIFNCRFDILFVVATERFCTLCDRYNVAHELHRSEMEMVGSTISGNDDEGSDKVSASCLQLCVMLYRNECCTYIIEIYWSFTYQDFDGKISFLGTDEWCNIWFFL